jgi:hypothetical protein
MHVKDGEPIIDMFARKSETMLGSAGHRKGRASPKCGTKGSKGGIFVHVCIIDYTLLYYIHLKPTNYLARECGEVA